jgi:hypothetical protein
MLNTSVRLIWNPRCVHLRLAKAPPKFAAKFRQKHRRLGTRLYRPLCRSLRLNLNLGLNLNLNPLLYHTLLVRLCGPLHHQLLATSSGA